MSTPELNKAAPAFDLPATGEQQISLASLKGSKVVLFFYPRDATPGCTTESQNFRDSFNAFSAAGAIVLGISQDSLASHEKFKAKQAMPFDLLSDEDGAVCRAYDVIKLKKMYGKEFEGIERSTFLIDEKGILLKAWLKVKVPGHVDEVLAAVQAL
ncbi:MAG: peroxiredoxin [Granulosicoccus sp.]